jgi:REP element-mobilizing transposase RayT
MGRRGRNNLTDENFFFITTTIVKFLPIFKYSEYCDILIANVNHYKEKYRFSILGYVIMPTHFHWIVEVNSKLGSISEIMRDIKKFTAWQIFDKMELTNDRELISSFEQAAIGIKDQNRKLWMKRFDDEVIRDQEMFWTKLNYIHKNPVKSGLVLKAEDYKYSSARNYAFNDHSVLEVNTEFGGIDLYSNN